MKLLTITTAGIMILMFSSGAFAACPPGTVANGSGGCGTTGPTYPSPSDAKLKAGCPTGMIQIGGGRCVTPVLSPEKQAQPKPDQATIAVKKEHKMAHRTRIRDSGGYVPAGGIRTGRNPQSGRSTKSISAKKVVKFKAGKALAETVK